MKERAKERERGKGGGTERIAAGLRELVLTQALATEYARVHTREREREREKESEREKERRNEEQEKEREEDRMKEREREGRWNGGSRGWIA